MRKTYKGLITSLKPNQWFVFGSNTEGRHGKGAAKQAMEFGAIYGQSIGFQGQCYAIITKDLTKSIHPSINKESIQYQIGILYHNAIQTPEDEYLIAYSGTGTNLNGYTNEEMAWMFCNPIEADGDLWASDIFNPKLFEIPKNIIFEESFYNLIQQQLSPKTDIFF